MHRNSVSVALRALSLWLLLGSALAAQAPMFPKTDALPGACMCDMAYCCSGVAEGRGSPCQLLEPVLAGLTSAKNVEGFCAPYLNGTLDDSTYVCEAIIQDAGFSERFGNGGWDSIVLSTGAMFENCEDIILDACPAGNQTSSQEFVSGLETFSHDTCVSNVDGYPWAGRAGSL